MDRQLISSGYYDKDSSFYENGDVPVAVSIRDGIVDCGYYGSAVLVDKEGKILWSIGNLDRLVFERSLVKPFKALSVIREGAARAFSLNEKDIAVIAGSHNGTMEHVDRVNDILIKCGLTSNDLKCGKRLPLGDDALWELANNKTNIINEFHCDCSGEHAGTLALCKHLGFPIENYLDINHPVQKVLFGILMEFSSDDLQYNPSTIDRCGMPIAAIPLCELALRFLKLIMFRENDKSVNYLVNSIIKNPYLYTGNKRLIGEIITRSNGKIIGKEGAEGVYTITWLDEGVCLAVKIGCGAHKAALPVIVKATHSIGINLPDVWDCINEGEFAPIIGL